MKIPFTPEQASTIAGSVDSLYLYILAITVFFTAAIYALAIIFTVKYRRRTPDEIPAAIHGNLTLEITWTIIPLLISMTIFVWATLLGFKIWRAPQDAQEIFVVGKQWMWKIQHPTGQREINELHIPAGKPIRLKMTSEDVIHSFYIPAFRTKMDVIPGRYTSSWFEATKPGKYHLFCAEYCGTKHSGMIGYVYVLSQEDYQAWLENGTVASTPVSVSGDVLFKNLRCTTCHTGASGALGPNLAGIFGKNVQLADGSTVKVDEKYIRESILKPTAKTVAGYAPLMPSFQGQVTEEQIIQIIQYIKGLKENPAAPAAAAETAPQPASTEASQSAPAAGQPAVQ